MMAYVQRRDRPTPEALPSATQKAESFDSMLAYTAAYEIEDDRVIHIVDGSWNPIWGKTPLIRPFNLDGDRLVISGAPGHDPATGEEVVYRMEFQRVPAARSKGDEKRRHT
jgi:hypothetical protein